MKRAINDRWRISLVVLCLSLGLAAGSAWVCADDMAPAAAPAADAKAQAVEHFKKAKALFDDGKFAEADAENNLALSLDPSLLDAKLLHKIIAARISTASESETPATGAASSAKVRLLTNDQILIRLHELSGDVKTPEANLRGSIPRKTIEDFWTTYMVKDYGANVTREQHDRFVSPANFPQQVYQIRESDLPQFMEKVTLTSDPADLIAFRNTVQPYVLQNCATAVCHSGEKGGAFRLAGRYGAVSVPDTYTNFYIMSMYATKDGGKVINRDEPAKSLFLQYGLPRNVAQFPHPDVPGFKPRFADETNDVYKSMVAWVKTLAFPRPKYGIIYELPAAATKPAPK